MPDVNIGAVANDGTGDPLRDAFGKLNANDQTLAGSLVTLQGQVAIDLTTKANLSDLADLAQVVDTKPGDENLIGANSYSEDLLDEIAVLRFDLLAQLNWRKPRGVVPQLVKTSVDRADGILNLTKESDGRFIGTNMNVRTAYAPDGFGGGVFEPASVSFTPSEFLGGSEWAVTGLNHANNNTITPAVDGFVPKTVTATAGGASGRMIGVNTGVQQAGWHQLDFILKPDVPFILVRIPGPFTTPSGGGGGHMIVLDMVNKIMASGATGLSHSDPVFTDLPGGLVHVAIRMLSVNAGAPSNTIYIYPKDTSVRSTNSTFTAGQTLFTLHYLGIQLTPALRLPLPNLGMGIAVAADRLVIPIADLPVDAANWTVELRFRMADGYVGDSGGVIPVLKIGNASDTIERGVGIGIVGESVSGIIRGAAAQIASIPITDVYNDEYHVAMSFDGVRLAMSVNGVSSTVTVAAANRVGSYFNTLYLGAHTRVHTASNTYPFSGLVHFCRIIPGALSALQLDKMTEPDEVLVPGGSVTVVGDGVGTPIISANADGSVNLKASETTSRYLLGGALWAGALPPDAMAVTPRPDGSVDFLSDEWGGSARRYRLTPEGYSMVYRGDNAVDVIWCNGQSLAYGNVYYDPVVQPEHPGFLDVDDGLANSVFGYSSVGYYNDKFKYPFISTDIGGPGGVTYPAINALARLRADGLPGTRGIIAKTIGQSGAAIRDLWPWGIYANGKNGALVTGGNETHWLNVRRWHESVRDALTRLGLTARVPAHIWVQGTADASNPNYYANLLSSRADHLELTEEFFGPQETLPLWIMTQSGGRVNTSGNPWDICEHQLQFCDEQPGAILATPLYAPDYEIQEANVHPSYPSTTHFGEVIGWAIDEVLNGRKWHLGTPTVTVEPTHMIFDYSEWLRNDERLVVAPDTYYGGVGIDAGMGFEIVDIVRLDTTGTTQRHGAPCATITSVDVINDGTAYRANFAAPMVSTLGYQVRYASQRQDMTTLSPLFYAKRGLLRTDLTRPSLALPGRTLHRWIPSYQKEYIT